jgi:quinol monooxygenase YgiN
VGSRHGLSFLRYDFALTEPRSIGTVASLIATAAAVLGFAGVAKADPSVSQDVVLVYGELAPQLQPLLIAPLDERHGTFVMPSSSQYHPIAQHAGQIIVIAHVDFVAAGLAQGVPALKKFATQSMTDPGVVLFTPITWSPTNNHFQLIEIYDSLNSFDEHIQAAHTVAFRNTIRPLVGAPYDERRYVRSILDVSKYPFELRAPSKSGLRSHVRPRAWARSITRFSKLAFNSRSACSVARRSVTSSPSTKIDVTLPDSSLMG